MKKQNKKRDEQYTSRPLDPEMIHILQDSLDTWEDAVNRAREYVRANELKRDHAKAKLDAYMKGELYNYNDKQE